MTHRDERQWLAYLKNELTDEEQGQAEAHLYGCDICLARWEQALSLLEDAALPTLAPLRAESMTDAVMEAIAGLSSGRERSGDLEPVRPGTDAGQSREQKAKAADGAGNGERRQKRRDRDRERWRAFMHYAIAVSITLVLMSTGLWKTIDAGAPSSGERHHGQSSGEAAQQQAEAVKGSYTERLMNRTVGVLEQWTEKAAGKEAGSNNEKGMGS